MVIKINNIDVRFGFGLYFLGKAQKKSNTDIQGLLNNMAKNPIADIIDYMYYSAECEAELDGVDLQISKRDFISFLEKTKDFDNENGVLKKWSDKLIESITENFLPKVDDAKVNELEVKEAEEVKKK